jgi:hypothetical protein
MAAEGLDGGTAGDALRHLCLRSLPVASLGAKVDTHLHSILQNLIVSHQSILTTLLSYQTLSSPPSTSLPELPGVSPAPLSLSSGGLAGRSDRERGARPPVQPVA